LIQRDRLPWFWFFFIVVVLLLSAMDRYLSEMRSKGWIATVGEGSVARQYLTKKSREAARRNFGGT
jgi:hypothetical protein